VGARWEVSGSCVRTLIRRYRVPIPERVPKCHRTAPCARTQLLYRAIAIRNTEGLSWSIIADRVGWEKSAQALYAAVKRSGIRYKKGYPEQRKPR
jgi:transposase